MKNLLLGDYLNISLRAHPQRTLSILEEILVINSGEKVYFFDIDARVQTGSSGLTKTVKKSDILDQIRFGEPQKPHPNYLQRLIGDSTKDDCQVGISKILFTKFDWTVCLFENGQAVT